MDRARTRRARHNGSMRRIGLVLGAGGLTGQAFHVGVVAAMHEHLGWDARQADLIVGTSAGAGIGTYLRLGISPADMAARACDEAVSPEGQVIIDRFGDAGDWNVPTLPRVWHPPHRNLLTRLAREPWTIRPESLLGVSLPGGRVDTATWTAAFRRAAGDTWPSPPLWICAVRIDDAHRVVFGRADAPRTDIASAVGASSAIPGYFAPVTIHGRRYVDGAVHSPTNADVVRREELDLVVVSSPMSISGSASLRPPSRAARRHFRARLGQEVRRLRRLGSEVVTFQPSEADMAVISARNALDPEVADVVRQVRETTLRRLRDRPLAALSNAS